MFWRKSKSKQANRIANQEKSSITPRRQFWLIALFVFAVFTVSLVLKYEALVVKQISLSGTLLHVDRPQVKQQLQSVIGQRFFSVDIQQVQELLSQQPWVESVSIRRIWPDTLSVAVAEKQPAARWSETELMSQKGDLFEVSTATFQQLPMIHGEQMAPIEMLAMYQQIEQQFSTLDLGIKYLFTDKRGAISFQLDNEIKVQLGQQQVEKKMLRLISIYQQQIQPKHENIKQIDMRYSNGFAIAWKTPPADEAKQASSTRSKTRV